MPRKTNQKYPTKIWSNAQTEALLKDIQKKSKSFMHNTTSSRSNYLLNDDHMRINSRNWSKN